MNPLDNIVPWLNPTVYAKATSTLVDGRPFDEEDRYSLAFALWASSIPRVIQSACPSWSGTTAHAVSSAETIAGTRGTSGERTSA